MCKECKEPLTIFVQGSKQPASEEYFSFTCDKCQSENIGAGKSDIVSRENQARRMQAIGITLLGGFFGGDGVVGLLRDGLTLSSTFMLAFGCWSIIYGIVKYRRVADEENNFPTT